MAYLLALKLWLLFLDFPIRENILISLLSPLEIGKIHLNSSHSIKLRRIQNQSTQSRFMPGSSPININWTPFMTGVRWPKFYTVLRIWSNKVSYSHAIKNTFIINKSWKTTKIWHKCPCVVSQRLTQLQFGFLSPVINLSCNKG